MVNFILTACFYILFAITPLIFWADNKELFEYNKMMFVYLLATIIGGFWLIKIIKLRKLIYKRTPLEIPILLFLGANILATIFSIDPHTSIWGYYTRSNGGLLSIISYTLLYFALVSNFSYSSVINFLKAGFFSGVMVSLYAIPEHFGLSPSCVILSLENYPTYPLQFNADCWVQNVQARVFATLGQPNWLAAYLAMLIFPGIYFLLNSKSLLEKLVYYFSLISLYMAFTFTYSRGGTLGLLAGIGVFVVGLFFINFKEKKNIFSLQIKLLLLVLVSFLIVNLRFDSAFIRFALFPEPSSPTTTNSSAVTTPGVTQLENGGNESGQIRLIVWKGATDIFRAYPIFGSGVETFAYSYYQYRPKEHNLTAEWDFLYNKAHNEYLNYLANTGIVGFVAYVLLILTFIMWSVKQIFNLSFSEKSFAHFKFLFFNQISNSSNLAENQKLLVVAMLASYTSYLVQNVFGFSIVMIAVFFYLFPAIIFVATENAKQSDFSNGFIGKVLAHLRLSLGRRFMLLPFKALSKLKFNILVIVVIFILTFSYVLTIGRLWVADTHFATGTSFADSGNPGQAYNELSEAVYLNPSEPLYHTEIGNAASGASLALLEKDATLSAQLKDQALLHTERALEISPNNLSIWRIVIQTYYQISFLDESYNKKTIEAFDKAISLAPTDAGVRFNKSKILWSLNMPDEAIKTLIEAIELKPNYREAHNTLGEYYFETQEYKKAIDEYTISLQILPDPVIVEKIEETKKKLEDG